VGSVGVSEGYHARLLGASTFSFLSPPFFFFFLFLFVSDGGKETETTFLMSQGYRGERDPGLCRVLYRYVLDTLVASDVKKIPQGSNSQSESS